MNANVALLMRLFETLVDGIKDADASTTEELTNRLRGLRSRYVYDETIDRCDHHLFDWLTHTIAFVRSRKDRG